MTSIKDERDTPSSSSKMRQAVSKKESAPFHPIWYPLSYTSLEPLRRLPFTSGNRMWRFRSPQGFELASSFSCSGLTSVLVRSWRYNLVPGQRQKLEGLKMDWGKVKMRGLGKHQFRGRGLIDNTAESLHKGNTRILLFSRKLRRSKYPRLLYPAPDVRILMADTEQVLLSDPFIHWLRLVKLKFATLLNLNSQGDSIETLHSFATSDSQDPRVLPICVIRENTCYDAF